MRTGERCEPVCSWQGSFSRDTSIGQKRATPRANESWHPAWSAGGRRKTFTAFGLFRAFATAQHARTLFSVMTNSLALLGGSPVRTRPFTRWPVFDNREEQRLIETLRSGKWGRVQGTQVAEFERRFAALHDAEHCVAVVNGTVSLRLCLLAAGLPAECEIIVPPYTFLATASAVLEANMIPVFADVDLDTCTLSPAAVEAAITPRTRAIIVVHLGGQPAEMDALLAVAQRHNLVVFEDAAQAHGARYRGRAVGTLGLAGSFSFQSSKNLTSGEGGAIVTRDDGFGEKFRSLHNCGRVAGGLWYEHHFLGGNYRLSEFQGAVLNAQLDRFAEQAELRGRNGRDLAQRLGAIPGLHPQHRPASCTRHGYHLFLFRIDAEKFGAPRAAVLRALAAEGVHASAGYGMPLYHQPVFRQRAFGPYLSRVPLPDYAAVRCPNSEKLCYEQGAWLEQALLLGTPADLGDIVAAFEKVHAHRDALRAWARAQSG
jgi:dTDP-4-amino-4,6-dideoxygalactose transaminase